MKFELWMIGILAAALIVVVLPDISLHEDNQFTEPQFDQPLGEGVQQTIVVPVHAYIVQFEDAALSSDRDAANIQGVFENVNSLWNQADIFVDVIKIEEVVVSDVAATSTRNLYQHVVESPHYDQNVINAYFSRTLHGPNGIAFPQNVIMVADRTSVFDYRATAHEIGHELGLQHVPPRNRLMAQGVNGFDLVEEEIAIARTNAERLFG